MRIVSLQPRSSNLIIVLALLASFGALFASAKQFTVVQTTDVHGWVNGHRHEPGLDADFGDFLSMYEHLKAQASERGEEVLLFDSGDLMDGSGISDATPVRGQYIYDLAGDLPFDGMTPGNHDLYQPDTVAYIRQEFVPRVGNRYLTSNTMWREDGSPLGAQYRVFVTPLGTKVLVFGFIYDSTREANDTIVVPVEESVKQPYFKEALSEPNVDLIVVTCHIALDLQRDQINSIYRAVRRIQPSTPVLILAGHSHHMVQHQFDENCVSFESGSYFRQIGVVKFELTPSGLSNVSHYYAPTSVKEFRSLAGISNAKNFLTPNGKILKSRISKIIEQLGLNELLGCSEKTWNPKLPMDDPDNLFNLWGQEIMPKMLGPHKPTTNVQVYITDSGFLRYNLTKGKILTDDVFNIVPFSDGFCYFKGLRGHDVSAVLGALNTIPTSSGDDFVHEGPRHRDVHKWAMSQSTFESNGLYDIVSTFYDCRSVSLAMRGIGRVDLDHLIPYPIALGCNKAWQEYIRLHMKCQEENSSKKKRRTIVNLQH